MDSCKIITKCFSGIDVIAFIVEYTNGIRKTLRKDDVIKLAKMNKIENAGVVLDVDTNEFRLVLEDDNIDCVDLISSRSKFKFKGRVIKDDEQGAVGIKIEDKAQNEYTVSLQKAWELALYSSIDIIKARIINGKKYISYEDDKYRL